ncbi:MAG: HlyD family efflux transporter periplasmic adaptor subunit [Opitutaceae bacterium]|nr:HlyD family efflux transporter periplasmic adaptor subunit [Cytophagales bacterium]
MNYLFPERDDFYSLQLLQKPKHSKIFAWWFGGFLLMIFLGLFLPWTQNIKGKGKITAFSPQGRTQAIPSLITGRISKWHISEGQRVTKGDTIVTLEETKEKFLDPRMLERLASQIKSKKSSIGANRAKAQAYSSQIEILKLTSNLSFSKTQNKVEQARQKVRIDSMDLEAVKFENKVQITQLERTEGLLKQGLKSLTETENKRSKYQESMAKLNSAHNKLAYSIQDLQNALIELNTVRAEYQDKIFKAMAEYEATISYVFTAEAEIMKMDNELESLRLRSGFYFILAPQDGFVIKATQAGLGDVVKENEAVINILPINREMAAEIYLRPIDIPLIKSGAPVRLQFEGWPVIVFSGWQGASFGTFGGIVKVVDKVDTDGLYRLLVVPDDSNKKWPEILPMGSGVKAWAMLNDVSIWYEIWREMNGFPPNEVLKSSKKESKYKENK